MESRALFSGMPKERKKKKREMEKKEIRVYAHSDKWGASEDGNKSALSAFPRYVLADIVYASSENARPGNDAQCRR